tara:strand:+ start:380 stop:874 length:495 start_codon:yes stop_codon:yes gene_type:complete
MSTLRVDNLRGQTADGKDRYVTQVKQFVLTTADSITSTSFIDSSVTLSITPSSVTNKIRATVNGYFAQNFWHASPYFRLRRDSTQISFNEGSHWPRVQYDSTRDSESGLSLVMDILDSPASTSSVTYTLQVRTTHASYPVYLNRTVAVAGPMAQTTLTLMEIAQ